MIKLLIDGKTISITPLQALDLQAQIIKQLRTTFTPPKDKVITTTPSSFQVKMITTAAAIELARHEGKNLPATTLRTALNAGAIPGIQKPAGRRLIPESEFRKWLANYKSKGQ